MSNLHDEGDSTEEEKIGENGGSESGTQEETPAQKELGKRAERRSSEPTEGEAAALADIRDQLAELDSEASLLQQSSDKLLEMMKKEDTFTVDNDLSFTQLLMKIHPAASNIHGLFIRLTHLSKELMGHEPPKENPKGPQQNVNVITGETEEESKKGRSMWDFFSELRRRKPKDSKVAISDEPVEDPIAFTAQLQRLINLIISWRNWVMGRLKYDESARKIAASMQDEFVSQMLFNFLSISATAQRVSKWDARRVIRDIGIAAAQNKQAEVKLNPQEIMGLLEELGYAGEQTLKSGRGRRG